MSIDIQYNEIQSVKAISESSGWSIRAARSVDDQGIVALCVVASGTTQLVLSRKDAADFGAALIKLAKQS